MSEPVRYSDTITARCQPEVTVLIDRAARRRLTKPSEWLRQAVVAALLADGFDPAQVGALRSSDSQRGS
jgi:hypothetical protein